MDTLPWQCSKCFVDIKRWEWVTDFEKIKTKVKKKTTIMILSQFDTLVSVLCAKLVHLPSIFWNYNAYIQKIQGSSEVEFMLLFELLAY